MKVIIDTDKKEVVLIGLATLDEINAFIKERNLEDYSISGTDTSTHWYREWRIGDHREPVFDPPYEITCTDNNPFMGLIDKAALRRYWHEPQDSINKEFIKRDL
jgi:hypothetical protein